MIKRNLLEQLKGHLSKKEISLIVGPRQAGKTTLMLLLKEYLESLNTLVFRFIIGVQRIDPK
jgi:predicted AAA+ superfamily ATPase